MALRFKIHCKLALALITQVANPPGLTRSAKIGNQLHLFCNIFRSSRVQFSLSQNFEPKSTGYPIELELGNTLLIEVVKKIVSCYS